VPCALCPIPNPLSHEYPFSKPYALELPCLLDGEADVVTHHGEQGVLVVGVHVRRDGGGESSHGVGHTRRVHLAVDAGGWGRSRTRTLASIGNKCM